MNENARVIATAFALCGFAVAVTCGLLADNSAHIVILRALLALILCKFVGTAAAHCIMHAIDEHVQTYIYNRPVPPMNSGDYEQSAAGNDMVAMPIVAPPTR